MLVRLFLLISLTACAFIFYASAQTEDTSAPVLVDEFGRLNHCDLLSRIDNFLAELSANPSYRGYIINYKAPSELPGQKDVYSRETLFLQHLDYRRFDPSRITFVRGGYSEDYRTQLYRLPPGAEPPKPSDTVPEPKIDEKSTFLFNESNLGWYVGIGDYGDEGGIDLDEYVLESVKAREAAEQAAQEAELAAEQDEEETQTSDAASTPSEEDPSLPVEEPLSEEERLALTFKWTDVGLAKFMSSRKKSTAVLLFYADDERYDIAKLRAHIEQGRDRLAKEADIKADRFRIEFGGYRDAPQVEFWFVPHKGKQPVAKPEERKPPKEEEQETLP